MPRHTRTHHNPFLHPDFLMAEVNDPSVDSFEQFLQDDEASGPTELDVSIIAETEDEYYEYRYGASAEGNL